MRKAKAVYLSRDVKENKKAFFKHIRNKRKTRESVVLLLYGRGTLVTEDSEDAELSNAFFTLVFITTRHQESLTQETRVKEC